jgi:hypothetical protein
MDLQLMGVVSLHPSYVLRLGGNGPSQLGALDRNSRAFPLCVADGVVFLGPLKVVQLPPLF